MSPYAKLFALMLLAPLLIVAVMPRLAVAPGQDAPPPKISAELMIEAARVALAKGELDDAEFILEGVKPGEGTSTTSTSCTARSRSSAANGRLPSIVSAPCWPAIPTCQGCVSTSPSPISRPARTAGRATTSAWRLATRICRPSYAPAPSPFSTRSGGASRGRSAARWPLPPTPTSTRRPVPARWPCSGCRHGFRTTRAKPAAWV